MKIITLQISKVVSNTHEGEAVYETHPVKLIEGKNFNDYIEKIPVMGYVSSKTKILGVIERKGKDITEVDPSEYEAKVRAAFIKPVDESNRDYKSEFEEQKKRNDELEKRLAALENKEPSDKELRVKLFSDARVKGLNPAKNITTADLKLMVENQ